MSSGLVFANSVCDKFIENHQPEKWDLTEFTNEVRQQSGVCLKIIHGGTGSWVGA